jgi:hypothetical protein
VAVTFFATHSGIDVNGHERALHRNFRSSGDTIGRKCEIAAGAVIAGSTTRFWNRFVVCSTQKAGN